MGIVIGLICTLNDRYIENKLRDHVHYPYSEMPYTLVPFVYMHPFLVVIRVSPTGGYCVVIEFIVGTW